MVPFAKAQHMIDVSLHLQCTFTQLSPGKITQRLMCVTIVPRGDRPDRDQRGGGGSNSLSSNHFSVPHRKKMDLCAHRMSLYTVIAGGNREWPASRGSELLSSANAPLAAAVKAGIQSVNGAQPVAHCLVLDGEAITKWGKVRMKLGRVAVLRMFQGSLLSNRKEAINQPTGVEIFCPPSLMGHLAESADIFLLL
jgi:hypothetical protein